MAQQLPATLALPTALVDRAAKQMQSMAAYMGGSAEREANAIVADLQNAAMHQLVPAPTP